MTPSTISKKDRLDMVMKGFNPLNPDDVTRYFNKGKPSYELIREVVKAKPNETLGSHKNSEGDYNLLKEEFPSDFSDYDPLENKRGSINNLNINHLEALREVRKTTVNNFRDENKSPQSITQNPKISMTPQEAHAIGYKKGSEMINSFLDVADISFNNKLATVQRKIFFKKVAELAQIQIKMEAISYEIASSFESGIAQAESEFMGNILGES